MSKSIKDNYYSGGLGLIITSPSEITKKYFKEWFDGQMLASAASLLGLPYCKDHSELLVFKENQSYLDLTTEEKVLYNETIFSYKSQQKTFNQTPQLRINPGKLFNLFNWLNTLKIIYVQSKWISSPENVVKLARRIVDDIPELTGSDIDIISQNLKGQVWNRIIAVGMLSEFISQLIKEEFEDKYLDAQSYINFKAATGDWLSRSIWDQQKVRNQELSFSEYIKLYGMRADVDYELTSPRWIEIQDEIKHRIMNLPEVPKKENTDIALPDGNQKLIEASVQLQILRSEARKKTLSGIYALRTVLLKDKSIAKTMVIQHRNYHNNITDSLDAGFGVSKGQTYGKVVMVDNDTKEVAPGSIGVFANAGADLSHLYPLFEGLIFLQGGVTSHGSIIAREYSIPAIISSQASTLENDTYIGIDGVTGLFFESPEKLGASTSRKQNLYKEFDFNSLPISKISKVLWFKDIKKSDKEIVGAKAYVLAKLRNEGFNVPDGFVISAAMIEHLEENKDQILNMFGQLGVKSYAVRSSFLGEDSSRLSFAGQFKSVLNVRQEDVFKSIHEVFNSAVDFENRMSVSGVSKRMSVVIQVMIESEISGVLFTENPLGKESEMIIEFSNGFNKVTAGTQNINRIIVNKISKDFNLMSGELKHKEIQELVNTGILAEEMFKKAQDIEWAKASGKIYILQARPVTS